MLRVESVTSAANPLIKDVRRAVARGGLTSEGWCVAEGFHLLGEAVRRRCEIHAVLVSESVQRAPETASLRLIEIPDALFRSIASTETSQGVITLTRLPEWPADSLFNRAAMVIVLDGVQDPGNAGAIVRAAEAFGASGVIFSKGSANPHHPKTLRGSAGSLFSVPFLSGCNAEQVRELLARHGVTTYAAMPYAGSERAPEDADFTAPCAIVIGSEAHGVSAELRAIAAGIAIPTRTVESLNAAVAASILLYEASRQRSRKAVPA